MNKKRDRYFGKYEETSRDSRVKMYKSGKQWVSALLSRIALLRVLGKDASQEVKADTTEIQSGLSAKSKELIKGIAAVGALTGGAYDCN